MGHRHNNWARRERARLMLVLGNACAACGDLENLTFDCIESRGHEHHSGSPAERMAFYIRESRRGNIQVLCQACNSIKGDLPQDLWLDAVSIIRQTERRLRPREDPGRDRGLSAWEFRDLLRIAVENSKDYETVPITDYTR